jgi:hypothetical protein
MIDDLMDKCPKKHTAWWWAVEKINPEILTLERSRA